MLILVVPAVLGAGPASASGGSTGTVRVTLTNAPGTPAVGTVALLPVGGTWADAVRATGSATHDLGVPPGRYAVVGMTPWGGLVCAGVWPCAVWALAGDAVDGDGAVDVVAGGLTTYTLAAPPPARITGERTLQLVFSPEMEALDFYLTAVAEYGAPVIQWTRDGDLIPGAFGPTHVVSAADAGTRLGVELSYHPYAAYFLAMNWGVRPEPVTVEGPLIGEAPEPLATRTAARLLPRVVPRTERARVRVSVSAARRVTGEVRVVMGQFRRVVALDAGRATVRLPQRRPGRYAVRVHFLGTTAFAPSSAQRLVLRVGPGGS